MRQRLSRADAVSALAAESFDVLVVGGGITGAGVALDAATRGYSVALVERGDFAIGTSSRSSKLAHGGLRYPQNFDLGLVRVQPPPETSRTCSTPSKRSSRRR